MICRILADQKLLDVDPTTHEAAWRPGGRLAGGFTAGLGGFDMPFPGLSNPRVRFWFTEKGWREVGVAVAAQARREGHVVRIVCRKNPLKSEVAYRDELQVALMPQKRKKC